MVSFLQSGLWIEAGGEDQSVTSRSRRPDLTPPFSHWLVFHPQQNGENQPKPLTEWDNKAKELKPRIAELWDQVVWLRDSVGYTVPTIDAHVHVPSKDLGGDPTNWYLRAMRLDNQWRIHGSLAVHDPNAHQSLDSLITPDNPIPTETTNLFFTPDTEAQNMVRVIGVAHRPWPGDLDQLPCWKERGHWNKNWRHWERELAKAHRVVDLLRGVDGKVLVMKHSGWVSYPSPLSTPVSQWLGRAYTTGGIWKIRGWLYYGGVEKAHFLGSDKFASKADMDLFVFWTDAQESIVRAHVFGLVPFRKDEFATISKPIEDAKEAYGQLERSFNSLQAKLAVLKGDGRYARLVVMEEYAFMNQDFRKHYDYSTYYDRQDGWMVAAHFRMHPSQQNLPPGIPSRPHTNPLPLGLHRSVTFVMVNEQGLKDLPVYGFEVGEWGKHDGL